MNTLRLIKEVNKSRQWPALTIGRCMAIKVESKTAPKYDDKMEDKPIEFFGSKAALWRAKDSRSGGADKHLWYQPYVISASLLVFLVYFCILREESDIDLKLEGNLFDHVKGLEEVQLTVNYKYNKENGLDNKEVAQRLKELGIDVNLLDAKIAQGN